MSRHPYYRDLPYPRPTEDIAQLRHDLFDWGFCLVEDGMSDEQVTRLRELMEEQAAGERAAGMAYVSESFHWRMFSAQDHRAGCARWDPPREGPAISQPRGQGGNDHALRGACFA
jgi:hypothetical protein